MTNRLPLGLLAAGAFMLAACAGDAPPTPQVDTPPPASPQAVTPQPATPQPATPAPLTPDLGTPGAASPDPAAGTPGAFPTLPAEDPELAAMLPDTVGGMNLIKVSIAGEQFMPTAGEDFANFVEDLGVDPSGITAATATGQSADASQSLIAFALRMPGTTAQQLIDTYSQSVQESQEEVTITPTQLGGKTVYEMSGGGIVQPTYFYAIDEIFFVVAATDQALTEQAFTELP